MVLATGKPNFLLASCCRVEVVNGGAGDFFAGLVSTSATLKVDLIQSFKNCIACCFFSNRCESSAVILLKLSLLLMSKIPIHL